MSSPLRVCKGLFVFGVLPLISLSAQAQQFATQGEEYSISGNLRGDQTAPAASLHEGGGYAVWQDNAIDGSGLGIAARRLDGNQSGSFEVFRVNQTVQDNQEKPKVARLANGGAIFVWQGGTKGFPNIFARVLGPDGTFTTEIDVPVNDVTGQQHVNPCVAALPNGNAVVVWSSFGTEGTMHNVVAQILSASGGLIGGNFQLNLFTAYNQRNPAVAVLPSGNFVAVWISEHQRIPFNDAAPGETQVGPGLAGHSVDVIGRVFDSNGQAVTWEFKVSQGSNLCSMPSVDGLPSGGFRAAWSEFTSVTDSAWDVVACSFAETGVPTASPFVVNSTTWGKQYTPKLVSAGSNRHLVVWTSLWQDASREGIFARLISAAGVSGDEFRINTVTEGQQLHPAVAADGNGKVLVLWAGYSPVASFDIRAQRFAVDRAVPTPAAPFVAALSHSSLSVTWPELVGFPIDHYLISMDGQPAVKVTESSYKATQLAAGSTHAFKLTYVLAGDIRSSASTPGVGATWDEDENFDGLPDDWQARYWPGGSAGWPSANTDTDGDGVTNRDEFLAGTNPVESSSVLGWRIVTTPQGPRLYWNTQPGFIYQVQSTLELPPAWSDLGGPRLAADQVDSADLVGSEAAEFYRVLRLR